MQNHINSFKQQRLAVIFDDLSTLPSAVLVTTAVDVTAERMNFIIQSSRGIVMAALPPSKVADFMLAHMGRPQTIAGEAPSKAARTFCVSVEAREGVSTGISAADRAATMRILGNDSSHPRQLVTPGHIFPVETRPGGILVRHALPEAAYDFVKIASCSEVACFADMLDEAGERASRERVNRFATHHSLPFICLSELISYRLEHEMLVKRVAEAHLPTLWGGDFTSYIYRSDIHAGDHLALVKGTIHASEPVLTRVQSESTVADVFGGDTPPSRQQIKSSLNAIAARGCGIFVYLRRPSRGQLRRQIAAWEDARGQQPSPMMREYGIGAQILRDLGVKKIELLSAHKKSLSGLHSFGLEIVAQRPLEQHTITGV